MKDTLGEKWFHAFNYAVLLIAGLSCLLPIMHVFAVSFSSVGAIMSGKVTFWPVEWTFDAYRTLIEGTRIVAAFKNSLLITIVGVAVSMVATVMAAYPLSRKYFYARRFLTLAIVFTMLFSGGIIPTYLVVKELGLLNSYAAIWLTGLVSAFNTLIMKSFFENIPQELEEAARIDGCGEARLLLRIFLPLSIPVIAALSLFYGVGHWNAFMSVLLYIHDSSKQNLTVLVQTMVKSQSLMNELSNISPEDMEFMTQESILSAAVMVMTIPMLMVYPFLQKYFIKGVMIGAIKG